MSDIVFGQGTPPAGPRRKMRIFMVNLTHEETGVDGFIHITTLRGSHGPAIAWYTDRPDGDLPSVAVTIEAEPRSVNHGVDSAQWRGVEAAVLRWVALNRDDLLHFWEVGATWTGAAVNDFIDRLKKLP